MDENQFNLDQFVKDNVGKDQRKKFAVHRAAELREERTQRQIDKALRSFRAATAFTFDAEIRRVLRDTRIPQPPISTDDFLQLSLKQWLKANGKRLGGNADRQQRIMAEYQASLTRPDLSEFEWSAWS